MGADEKNGLVAAEVMPEGFYEHVSGVLDAARRRAYAAVNFAMVEAYWEIGRSIVEQQGGAERAEYGEELLRSFPGGSQRTLGRGLTSAIFASCVSSTSRSQFGTHCVPN